MGTEVYCTFAGCFYYSPETDEYGICTKDSITLDESVSGRTCGCPDAEWERSENDE